MTCTLLSNTAALTACAPGNLRTRSLAPLILLTRGDTPSEFGQSLVCKPVPDSPKVSLHAYSILQFPTVTFGAEEYPILSYTSCSLAPYVNARVQPEVTEVVLSAWLASCGRQYSCIHVPGVCRCQQRVVQCFHKTDTVTISSTYVYYTLN